MQGQFEMYSDGVRPTTATGIKICAMERAVNKHELYCQYLQHVITDTKKSKVIATLQGKFKKLVDAKILLRSCFFIYVLTSAKVFSLQTLNSNISITDTNCVDTTKWNLHKTVKIICKWQKKCTCFITLIKISHQRNRKQRRCRAGISRSKAEMPLEWKRIFEKSLCQYR